MFSIYRTNHGPSNNGLLGKRAPSSCFLESLGSDLLCVYGLSINCRNVFTHPLVSGAGKRRVYGKLRTSVMSYGYVPTPSTISP